MKSLRMFLVLLLCLSLFAGLVPAAWAEESEITTLEETTKLSAVEIQTDEETKKQTEIEMAIKGVEAETLVWENPPAPSINTGSSLFYADTFLSADTYNAATAANYAITWWNSFNPNWYNWESEGYGDCIAI